MADQFHVRPWHGALFLTAVGAVTAGSAARAIRRASRAAPHAAKPPPRWANVAIWAGLNVAQVWADLRIIADRRSPDRTLLLSLRGLSWVMSALVAPPFLLGRGRLGGAGLAVAESAVNSAAAALLSRRDPLAASALAPLVLCTAYSAMVTPEGAEANSDRLIERMRWEGAL